MIEANTVSRNGEHLTETMGDYLRVMERLQIIAAAVATAWFTGAITVVARMAIATISGSKAFVRLLQFATILSVK
jgi:hypothetical protein